MSKIQKAMKRVRSISSILKKFGRGNTFHDNYSLGKELGSGRFAVVHECLRIRDNEMFAVKIMQKASLDKQTLPKITQEVQILKRMYHPNIVQFEEAFEDRKNIYVVMELVKGGELLDRLVERGKYSETDARDVTKSILSAVHYLHSHDIVHRDLKPENLLCVDIENNESCTEDEVEDESGLVEVPWTGDMGDMGHSVKLADFGLSCLTGDDHLLQTACGTPSYVAPEVLTGEGYGKEVDMWAIGVILYILLSGYPPFYHENTGLLLRRVEAVKYDFIPKKTWDMISDSAQDLVSKLLVRNPLKRLTVEEALDHPWIQSGRVPDRKLSLIQKHLSDYNVKRKFKGSIYSIIWMNRDKNEYAKSVGAVPSIFGKDSNIYKNTMKNASTSKVREDKENVKTSVKTPKNVVFEPKEGEETSAVGDKTINSSFYVNHPV